MAYDRAYVPSLVDQLPESPSAAQKKKYSEQLGALSYCEARKAEDVLCQFVNGLRRERREILIRHMTLRLQLRLLSKELPHWRWRVVEC